MAGLGTDVVRGDRRYLRHASRRAVAAATSDEPFDEREVFLIHANGVGVYVAVYQVLADTLSIAQLTSLAVALAAVNAAI
jgi:hypothetical protein